MTGGTVWPGMLLGLGILLLTMQPASGQIEHVELDETFPASAIDWELAAGADAVLRKELEEYEVRSPRRADLRVRRVVTVLNPEGRRHGEFYIFHDGLRQVRSVEGLVRDAQGEVVRRMSSSELEDRSLISHFSLYDESRVKIARLHHDTYPYTVEIAYEVRFNNILVGWPRWYLRRNIPIEYARLEVESPPDLPVRYQVRGMDLQPIVSRSDRAHRFRWQALDQPALDPEPMGPHWTEQAVAVETAPAAFSIEGTTGDLSTWEGFGRWYYSLGEGRRQLPERAREDVQRLVEGIDDARERARLVYEYVQERTRYVSIQLGLGGWQPFDAIYVHERGYGDCKALSNYLQALLEEVGVASYPVIIRRGMNEPELQVDFPSNPFNHVLLKLPMEDGDPVWLEATSQTLPFGHIGADNEDRYALLADYENSRIVRTPTTTADQNRLERHATIHLTDTGHADVSLDLRFAGNLQHRIRRTLYGGTGRDRDEWSRSYLGFSGLRNLEVAFDHLSDRGETLRLPMSFTIDRRATATGTRLFLQPMLMANNVRIPPPAEDRRHPVRLDYARTYVDSLRYVLPEGYAVEAMPDPVLLDKPFGTYRAELVVEEDGELLYLRELTIPEATIPAEDFHDYRAFLNTIAALERDQVVLVRE